MRVSSWFSMESIEKIFVFSGQQFSNLLYIGLTLLFACMYTFPSVQVYINIQLVASLSAVFFVLYILRSFNKILLRNILLLILGYSSLMYLVAIPGDFKYGFLHPALSAWYFVFPGILCSDIIRRGNRFNIKIVAVVSCILLSIVLFNSVSQLQVNPTIMRDMTASIMDKDQNVLYKLQNIGGFGFSYTCGMLLVFTVALLLYRRWTFLWRLIIWSSILFLAYFVMNANFTTLLLLTFGVLLYTIYINIKSTALRFIIVCLAPIAIFTFPILLQAASEFYSGTVIGDKLDRMYLSFFGEGDVSDFSGARSQIQLDILKESIFSPIWGHNVTSGTNAFLYSASHSSFLGTLLATGLLGLYFHYKLLYIVFVNCTAKYKLFWKNIILPVIVYYSFLSIFNPAEAPELSWSLFAIIPLIINIIYINKYEKLEN